MHCVCPNLVLNTIRIRVRHRYWLTCAYQTRMMSASASMASASSAAEITSTYGKRRRLFAPLNPGAADNGGVKLQGLVFDVDGTLW